MMDRESEKVIKGLECCDALHNGGVVMCGTECPYGIADGIDRGCRGKLIPDALALLKAQEARTCSECQHYDTNAFTDMGGKCRNSRSCHYCYGCDKSFGCNAWEGR